MRPISIDDLRDRYDVTTIAEDEWHTHSGDVTSRVLGRWLPGSFSTSAPLLNAGAGVYALSLADWIEIPMDLFCTPLRGRGNAVCASAEHLPFTTGVFGAVVCTGEVLGYCDPQRAIREFSRVLDPRGTLIVDFRSTASIRYWRRDSWGRAADIIEDNYNGRPERTWVYDPAYIRIVLKQNRFSIMATEGAHFWSSLGVRLGLKTARALKVERMIGSWATPVRWSDLVTLVAART